MTEELNSHATTALIQLASAQDRLADKQVDLANAQAEMNSQMRTMNGSIRDHNVSLALGKQWVEHHVGPSSTHDVMLRRIDAIEKLAKTAIAIPTIIVIGGAIAGIVSVIF